MTALDTELCSVLEGASREHCGLEEWVKNVCLDGISILNFCPERLRIVCRYVYIQRPVSTR